MSFLKSLFDLLDVPLSVILLLVLIVLYYFFVFTQRVNRSSLHTISRLEQEGKYIRDLYVELDESKEELRYFLYQKNWKKRIVDAFNRIFNNASGKTLRKYVEGYAFRLSRYSSYEAIRKSLSKYSGLLQGKDKSLSFENKGDLKYYLDCYTYWQKNKIQELDPYCETAMAQSLIVIGAAGNGKTNLLCSFAELLTKLKYPCIFIEAKQIREDCVAHFKKLIPLPFSLNCNQKYLWLLNACLWLRRKHLFVIVDALNENDRDIFVESISNLEALLRKYSKIRIVYSCRSEFFEERFSRYFHEAKDQILIKTIHADIKNDRAYNLMFLRYREHFKFHGTISRSAKRRLYKSLILMRIFFEINQGLRTDVIELHKAELYHKYIKKMSSNHANHVHSILEKIICAMIQNNSFDEVLIHDLCLTAEDEKSVLSNLIDNSLLLSKKLTQNNGLLTQREMEVVYFPFDELRDFCIARYKMFECSDTNLTSVFEFINSLIAVKASPSEGVLKFLYADFRKTPNHIFCQQLLDASDISIEVPSRPADSRVLYLQQDRCLGVLILTEYLSDLIDFEKKYIHRIICANQGELVRFIITLLANEIDVFLDGITSSTYGIETLFEIFNDDSQLITHLQALNLYALDAIHESLKKIWNIKYKNGEVAITDEYMLKFFNLAEEVHERAYQFRQRH